MFELLHRVNSKLDVVTNPRVSQSTKLGVGLLYPRVSQSTKLYRTTYQRRVRVVRVAFRIGSEDGQSNAVGKNGGQYEVLKSSERRTLSEQQNLQFKLGGQSLLVGYIVTVCF